MKIFFDLLFTKIRSAKSVSRYRFAIIFSIVIHMMFFASHWNLISKNPVVKKEQTSIAVTDQYKEMIQKVRDIRNNKDSQKVRQSIKKQIVNNELAGTESKPDTDRFLGEKNQVYDRQTVAAKIGIFNKAGQGTKTGSKLAKAVAKDNKAGKSSGKKSTIKKFSLGDLAINRKIDPKKYFGTGDENKKLADMSRLGIKRGDLKSSGLSENNDFIDDVPLGDFTRLNTQEFKYYGFYHRIRQKLEQFWGDSLREKANKLYKSGRRMPASTNLITSLKITIDHKGNIVDVLVQGSSGVRELDNAAIESFNKAGPFPNPPKGMLTNGKAVIEWGFVVKS